MRNETQSRLHQVCADLVTVASMVRFDEEEVTREGDYIDIIKHYNHVREATSSIKEAREALANMEEQLSRVVIPDVLKLAKETRGIKTPVVIEGVGRVTVSYRFSCSMLDKDMGMDWLRGNGHGGLIQPTVNSSTLAAFAKDMLENQGKELPEDLFKTGTSPYTSITKVK